MPRQRNRSRKGHLMSLSCVGREGRNVLPMIAFALLFPLPWLNFWEHGAGRAFAFSYLFLGCALVAGECFRPPIAVPAGGAIVSTRAERRRIWDARMLALALAGAVSSMTFSAAY